MIETDNLTEGYVLTVQVRQEAMKSAVELVVGVPATLIEGDPIDVALKYAQRLTRYVETGATQ